MERNEAKNKNSNKKNYNLKNVVFGQGRWGGTELTAIKLSPETFFSFNLIIYCCLGEGHESIDSLCVWCLFECVSWFEQAHSIVARLIGCFLFVLNKMRPTLLQGICLGGKRSEGQQGVRRV